jgi:hypothetical protein
VPIPHSLRPAIQPPVRQLVMSFLSDSLFSSSQQLKDLQKYFYIVKLYLQQMQKGAKSAGINTP